jgi:hypothetical protein
MSNSPHTIPPAASLSAVRELLHEASQEPIDPGTNLLIDAMLELTEYVEQQHARGSDARAQLWARVYAAEFSACRHGTVIDSQESLQTASDALAMKRSRALADAAVRDFDEHYLGGKR